MQPVRRSGLVQQATAALREQIATGQWPVGERIPTEPHLCDLIGVGRNTVREAVQALVHAGLLERRQGSGTYVIASSEVSGVLGQALSAAQHRDVSELRLALEVCAAELAALRRTEDEVAQLRELSHARVGAREEADRGVAAAADVELHRAMVAAAHNPVLMQVYDSVLPTVELAVADNMGHREHDEEDLDPAHEAVVQAIAERDAAAAADAVRALLNRVLRLHLPAAQADPTP